MKKIYLLVSFLASFYSVLSQSLVDSFFIDKCGLHLLDVNMQKSLTSTNNWGYGYDDLLEDVHRWQLIERVDVSTIGKSVEGRDIYSLTVQDYDISDLSFRISIHSRTHPNEVQAWYVTNEIINLLTTDNELSDLLLANCVFDIVPMINPDGVELNKARQNANDVDIESNWASATPEPEVVVLQNHFDSLMTTQLPIDIMLNMHSAYACTRYFVYHHANGTNSGYALAQRRFIDLVQSYFEDGFEDYDYFVSWVNSTPKHYPESWFWYNHADKVLAMTYEDMNCSLAGNYQRTAESILWGIADYLGLHSPVSVQTADLFSHIEVYPNPVKFGNSFIVDLPSNVAVTSVKLIDVNGRLQSVEQIDRAENKLELYFDGTQSGVYFLQLTTNDNVFVKKVMFY